MGEITTPQQLEVVQQLVSSADYRKQLTSQVERIAQEDSKWVGAIATFMILFLLFCTSFALIRGITNFNHQQVEKRC